MQNPMVQSLLDRMQTGGWQAFENIGQQASEQYGRQLEEAQRQAKMLRDTFSTEAGKRCLEWLIETTLLRPPLPQQTLAPSAEQYALQAAQRDGQHMVVYMILHALSLKGKP